MLPVIPLTAGASVALMGIFAWRNQKQGWVKRRTTLIDSLREIKRDLLTTPAEVSQTPAVWYAGMVVNPVEFSQQLGYLQTSLQRAGSPALPKSPTRVSVTQDKYAAVS
jgi:hypothetical protein